MIRMVRVVDNGTLTEWKVYPTQIDTKYYVKQGKFFIDDSKSEEFPMVAVFKSKDKKVIQRLIAASKGLMEENIYLSSARNKVSQAFKPKPHLKYYFEEARLD